MYNIIAVLTYQNLNANIVQHRRGLGIYLKGSNGESSISINLSYGQCKGLADAINKALENTDIQKIDTELVGSIAAEYSYDNSVIMAGGEEASGQPEALAVAEEVKVISKTA